MDISPPTPDPPLNHRIRVWRTSRQTAGLLRHCVTASVAGTNRVRWRVGTTSGKESRTAPVGVCTEGTVPHGTSISEGFPVVSSATGVVLCRLIRRGVNAWTDRTPESPRGRASPGTGEADELGCIPDGSVSCLLSRAGSDVKWFRVSSPCVLEVRDREFRRATWLS